MQPIWGNIWKHTVEKSQTNVANVTMPLLGQLIWGPIWKYMVEKSQNEVAMFENVEFFENNKIVFLDVNLRRWLCYCTDVTKGLFKKSIFQWTVFFCQTVKLNRPPAFFKNFFKKTELLKKCYDKLVLPEMPGGIIYKKKFFCLVNICVKKWLFFPKIAIFYH